MSESALEPAAVAARAMEAYTLGRLDEARRLVAEALERDPTQAQVRQLAERLFPELLTGVTDERPAPAGTAGASTPQAAWEGSEVLEVDWGEVAAGLERAGHAEASPVPEHALPSAIDDPWAPAPPSGPAPAPDPVSPSTSPAPDPAPAAPAPPPPPETPSWAEALDTPWDEVVAPAVEAPPPASAGEDSGSVPLDDPWGPSSPGESAAPPAAPGLDLLAPVPPPTPAPTPAPPPEAAPAPDPRDEEVAALMDGARELHELGDFSGSLDLVEKVLEIDPESSEARDYLARNESTLVQMYESKLGPATAVPKVAIAPDEVFWLSMDHRAGFLLSQIDGVVSFEDLYALSGMSRLDTSRILARLVEEGVILTE